MPTIELILTALLSAIILLEIRDSSLIIRAERQLQLLADQSIGCHSSQGWIGCSVIYYRPNSLAHIENMLTTEYDLYEVVVIIDASANKELFSALVSQYKLIELNTPKHRPEAGAKIRKLLRSGQRRFRHLVLLDIANDADKYEAMNCALEIVSYNYVIPIAGNCSLRPLAIESIVIKLSDANEQQIELLESLSGVPCRIFRHDMVVESGGFTAGLQNRIKSRNRLYTYETYILDSHHSQTAIPRTAEIIWLLCGLTLLGIACTLTIKTIGNSFAIRISWAMLSTIVALRAIALYQITTCGIAKCSVRTMLCYFRRIGAIFSRRKFIVS